MLSLLTVPEVAERLHVSKDKVRELVHEGRLPVVRLCAGKFLFEPESIDRVVREAMAPALPTGAKSA